MARRIPKVSLEKLAKEKLAKQLIEDIDAIEIRVSQEVESGLSLEIVKGTIEFRLNYKISTKTFMVWFGGFAAAIGVVITILRWLMPILVGNFANPPP